MHSALSDLEEVLDPTHEHVQKNSLSWILQRCEKLNPSCKSYSQSRRLGKGESREVTMEEKKRKARERAMKAMKASASKFSAHITGEENTNKKEKGNDVLADPEWESGNVNGRKEDLEQVGEGGGDASLVAMGSDDEGAVQDGEISRTVCIVCQAEEEESCQSRGQGLRRQSPKIGFLAFSQCSHAATRGSQARPPALRLAADFESCEGDDGQIHLSFCGHGQSYMYMCVCVLACVMNFIILLRVKNATHISYTKSALLSDMKLILSIPFAASDALQLLRLVLRLYAGPREVPHRHDARHGQGTIRLPPLQETQQLAGPSPRTCPSAPLSQ